MNLTKINRRIAAIHRELEIIDADTDEAVNLHGELDSLSAEGDAIMGEADYDHYKTAIDGMVEYAKTIGYDPYTGDFDKLTNDWINHSKKMHERIIENKSDVICVMKQLV